MLLNTKRALLSGLLFTSACSNDPQQSITSNVGNEVTYTEWCQNWSLSCENIIYSDFPIDDSPYTVAQWQSLIQILEAALDSRSSFKIDREDILDPEILENLRDFAQQFNATELFESFIEQIQDGIFTSIRKPLMGDYIEFVPGVQSYDSESLGLTLAMNPNQSSIKVSISNQTIQIQGLELVSTDGQRSSINSITIDEQNRFNWQGNNISVGSVPMAALPELIGIDFSLNDGIDAPASGGVLGIIGPMFNILPHLDAEFSLGNNFWSTLRRGQHVLDLPGFEGPVRDTTLTFLSKTRSIKSIQNSAGELTGVDFDFSDSIICGSPSESMELRIKRDFTINDYQIRTDGINLDVSDIEVAIFLSPDVTDILIKDESMVFTAFGISKEVPLTGQTQVNCR